MGPTAAALVLLTPLTGQAVLSTGLLLSAMIAMKLVMARR
jgi:hypothetical protein